MFAAVLAVLLSCGSEDVAVAQAPLPTAAPARGHPVERARYRCWRSGYPYSQAYYSRNGYDFRHEYNIPWAVRSSYSLPIGAAANTRRFGAEIDPGAISPQPHAAPPRALGAESKPTGTGATSSK